MNLSSLLDADVLIALEPDELGLRLLPLLAHWPQGHAFQLSELLARVAGDQPTAFPMANYPPPQRPQIREALSEAWAWLAGAALLVPEYERGDGMLKLSRRARKLAAEPDPQRGISAHRLAKDTLHPAIREDVWALYHRGKYELAIIAAMKAFEVRVRQVGSFTNADHGKDMIARAFNSKNGPLRDETAEPAERDALFALMTGAFGLYRNPYVHRKMEQDDPDEAAEIIMLANHLLRIVDVRETALKASP